MSEGKINTILMAVTAAVLLSFAAGPAFAAKGDPMTPGLAAKREVVRKQQEQRVTNEKRQTAAQALKAERLKIYRARQAAGQSSPLTIETK